MAELKTQQTPASVADVIAAVEPPIRREDAVLLDKLFRKATGQQPAMWGSSIIGYGRYHYRYDSGHEGDMCRAGFSPRKAKHSLYVLAASDDPADIARQDELLARLGKHSRGKGCLYITRLKDVNTGVLEDLICHCWDVMGRLWPE